MEIEHIREFMVLSETRNFTETAERLFTSQSTISKHLKQLESELGAPLFDRTGRRVELNEFGTLFLPYAKTILTAEYDCQTAFFNKLETLRETLTIGSIPVMAQYHITDIIIRFKKENTNFTIDVIEYEASDLIQLVRNGTCEAAFIRETGEPIEDLVRIPYFTDHLAALVPASHPFADRGEIELKELYSEEFMFLREKTCLYDMCIAACKEAGFTPNIVFTGHRLENMIDFVMKGMGIALLMKQQAAFAPKDSSRLLEIVPPVTNQISLVYRKNAKLSPAALHFIRCVQN